jgi:hypothetical protein
MSPWSLKKKKHHNIEHRTSNIECLMGKNKETKIGVKYPVGDVCISFDVGRSMFDVHLSKQLSAYGDSPPPELGPQ